MRNYKLKISFRDHVNFDRALYFGIERVLHIFIFLLVGKILKINKSSACKLSKHLNSSICISFEEWYYMTRHPDRV